MFSCINEDFTQIVKASFKWIRVFKDYLVNLSLTSNA